MQNLVELAPINELHVYLQRLDAQLASFRPTSIVLVTIVCVTLFMWMYNIVKLCQEVVRDKGIRQLLWLFLRSIPFIRKEYEKQQAKTINSIKSQLKLGGSTEKECFKKLPENPMPASEILTILHRRWSQDPSYQFLTDDNNKNSSNNQTNTFRHNLQIKNQKDQDESGIAKDENLNEQDKVLVELEAEKFKNVEKCKNGQLSGFQSKVSGVFYVAGEELKELLMEAYRMFSLSNPLHFDVFPSVRVIEQEVVRMTGSILGGDEKCCGCVTSGGTESILLTVKAARDYMRYHKGITKPELIIADSGHSAYYKAAEYFGIRLVVIPHDSSAYRLSARQVKGYISSNTIMVVASAAGYPHGIIDDVQGIAALTKKRGILLHVDCCLGGFVLPFLQKLGYKIPEFNFGVDGVTSISADTHKFAMSHKGTAVLLYRHAGIRKFQYTSITEWSGGLYISPGLAGSRPGGLSVTAWASMLYHGWQGYLDSTRRIMSSVEKFVKGLQNIQGLEIIGQPDMCVIAFKSVDKLVDIYAVNDLMGSKGWSLNALQRPAGIHVCFTLTHTSPGWIDQMLSDLQESVETVRENPQMANQGSAPLYGASNQTVDRNAVAEFLTAFQDIILDA